MQSFFPIDGSPSRKPGKLSAAAALVLAAGCLFFVSLARAEESGGLDWSAWQRMPALQDGRIKPLDSFARTTVKKICGEVFPLIGPPPSLVSEKAHSLSADEFKAWVAANPPRRFLAAEMLYSWYVDPAPWEDRQFLHADNEELRTKILDVPMEGEDGRRSLCVSPRQVRESKKFSELVKEVAALEQDARKKNVEAKLSSLQESAKELWEELRTFDQLSFDPGRGDGRAWVVGDVENMLENWRRFHNELPQLVALEPRSEISLLDQETDAEMFKLADAFRPMQRQVPSLASLDASGTTLRRVTARLAALVDKMAQEPAPDIPGFDRDTIEKFTGIKQQLARSAKSIALQAAEIQWSLYDAEGQAIFVVPSLEPTALEADRRRSEIHPWVSLSALLEGSPALLQGYDWDHVQEIRSSWNAAREAYLDGASADRRTKFADSMRLFTARLRAISAEIEPQRLELPIIERDKALLAKTAYPGPAAIDAEVLYNWIDPFHWAWCMSLFAASVLGLSYVALRKTFFRLGIATLIGSVCLLVGGFAVRISITHWAPVTSMFETIVWVAMCVAVLSLWMTFLPLLGPAAKVAWGLTAIPGSWEDKRKKTDASTFGHLNGSETPLRAVALTLRLVIFLAALYIVGVIPSLDRLFTHASPSESSYEYGLVSFLPRADIGSTLPGVSSTLVWLASLFVAGALTWYVPRLVPSALLAIGISAASMRRPEASEKVEKIYSLRVVALGGAVASFCAALAANYAPFPRDIQALMPVLRSNFWLGIHVLTITTSYAGAAAAWMIGNLALGYYIFGRYRTVERRPRPTLLPSNEGATDEPGTEQPTAMQVAAAILHVPYVSMSTSTTVPALEPEVPIERGERRPPVFCGTLANLNYRVMQVTVLLIAAGTILGGLWADVSWGRFWGWDPKEVGALIALLVLLTALHGRRAGWPGDLSLAIGSVFGFFGVLWAWYVVNFLLNAGMHSYGAGEGGQWLWLVIVVGAQLAYIFCAVIRVSVETRKRPA